MTQMTIKEIQQESLKILLDVDKFCRENNIHYSLAYGTLIGAIRHKGFIPWDDDIDIVMTRPEFDKFCKSYKSDRYKKSTPGDSYIAFARIYDDKTTYVEELCVPWHPEETGIWIDIFPMDAAPDEDEDFKKLARIISKVWNLGIKKRSTLMPLEKLSTVKKIKCIIKRLLYRQDMRSIITKHLELIARLEYGSTNHCCQLCCVPDNIWGEYMHNSLLNDYIELFFENHKFYAFKEYDKILRLYYGDYMQLPPLEQQVPKQNSIMKFMWR